MTMRHLEEAVVITKAPLRISLAGGGTDLPGYADRFGGAVVGIAIDRYVGVTLFPRPFGGGVDAFWEYHDRAADAGGLRNAFGKAVLERHGAGRPVQVSTFSDVPSGTGAGGSAAFAVALLHALRHRAGAEADPLALAEDAARIEMVDLGRPVGKQDHYLSALGGLRSLRIGRDRSVAADGLTVGKLMRDHLDEGLLLFAVGVRRDAGSVLAQQNAGVRSGGPEVLRSMHAIRELVDPMIEAFAADRPDRVGPLLDAHWRAKSRLGSRVSNPRVDDLYRTALAHGADGGKLLGAGGGGFLLVSCPPGTQDAVRGAMAAAGAPELPFRFSPEGTTAARMPL